jgi:hypothetical protein
VGPCSLLVRLSRCLARAADHRRGRVAGPPRPLVPSSMPDAVDTLNAEYAEWQAAA